MNSSSIFRNVLRIFLVGLLLFMIMPAVAFAAEDDTVNVNVEGTFHYEAAYEVLELTNEVRISQGLVPLEMDEELMDLAMQRAVENAISYGHTRPNGEPFYTILSNQLCYYGENIAGGCITPEGVMDAWVNSSGHYLTMTKEQFRAVGIGCYSQNDGYIYWTQLFTSENPEEPDVVLCDRVEERTVSVLLEKLDLGNSIQVVRLDSGENYQLVLENKNKNCVNVKQQIHIDGMNWSAVNPGVVSVDANGKVTALSKGVGYIESTFDDPLLDDVVFRTKIFVDNGKDTIEGKPIALSFNTCQYNGQARTPTVTVEGVSPANYTVEYFDNVEAGTATVVITGKAHGTDSAIWDYVGQVEKTFTITKSDISCMDAELEYETVVYDGQAKVPAATVAGLAQGTDYTVSYANNVNAGIATVTITGIGNYMGTITKTFNINAASIGSKTASLAYSRVDYDGKAKTPAVVISGLVKGTDYTVSYSNNVNAGKASVTIRGKGNYDGTIIKNFTIVEKIVLAQPTLQVVTDETTGKPVLSWTSVPGAARYEVYMGTDGKTLHRLLSTTAVTITHTAAVADTVYYYGVRPIDENGDAHPFSKAVQIKCVDVNKEPPANNLGAPTLQVTSNATTGKPVLSWTKVSGAAKYEIWRSTGGSYSKFVTTTGVKVTHAAASVGSFYSYKVRAIDANGNAFAFSNVAGVQCLSDATKQVDLNSSVVLTISVNSTGKIPTLSWNAVTGATKYEIWRSVDGGAYKRFITTTGKRLSSSGLLSGKTYSYKIIAVNASGSYVSEYSNTASFTCK